MGAMDVADLADAVDAADRVGVVNARNMVDMAVDVLKAADVVDAGGHR